MSGNIWIIFGMISATFSLFAIPYGFYQKNIENKHQSRMQPVGQVAKRENTTQTMTTGDNSPIIKNVIINNPEQPKTDSSTRDHAIKIEDEIHENYKKIKYIGDPKETVQLPDGKTRSRASANAAIAVHVKTKMWNALRPTISIELQRKYEEIYLYTDAISDDSKVPDQIKPIMLFDNAKSFVEEYQKLFGK